MNSCETKYGPADNLLKNAFIHEVGPFTLSSEILLFFLSITEVKVLFYARVFVT